MDLNKIKTELEQVQKKREENQSKIDKLKGQKEQILQQLKTTYNINTYEEILPLLIEKRKLRDTCGEKIQKEYDELKHFWSDI